MKKIKLIDAVPSISGILLLASLLLVKLSISTTGPQPAGSALLPLWVITFLTATTSVLDAAERRDLRWIFFLNLVWLGVTLLLLQQALRSLSKGFGGDF